MNKNIIISIISCLLLTGCNNYLDEANYGLVTPDTYPQSISGLEKCVNALYSIGNKMYDESGTYIWALAGDDVTTQSGSKKADILQFDTFSAENNNSRVNQMWDGAYQTIKQANVIISTIDNIKEEKLSAAYLSDQKNRALGQAYFMRALAYFNLVRVYGQVPIIDGINVDYTVGKAAFTDIYQHIVDDLTKAEQLCPADYTKASNASDLEKTTAYARATVGAVKSLMAAVYLNMAGYPIKDTSKYALAASKAKEVISNESTYGYKLLDNYGDLWKYTNGWKDAQNAEDVFACHFNTDAGDWSDNGTSSNGNMWAPSSGFPENLGGWSDFFAELNFFNEFPEGPRKDATFLTKGQKTPTDAVISWKNFTGAHPYYKKMVDMPGFDETNMGKYINWWSSRTMQVIRYAEVLLIYSEAEAMSAGPDELAYKCLNRVRNRAGLANIETGLSATAFRDKVLDERKWEFAGMEPCCRWFDMVRTETVASSTAKRNSSEVALVNKPDDSSHAYYFAPIPEKDVLLNPNLK